MEEPGTQAPHPSPVGAADAPSRAEGQVGLVHGLAVGLVVTERDQQRLLGADPLAAPRREKVGALSGPGPGEPSLRVTASPPF